MGIDYVQTSPILYTPEDKTAPFPAPPNNIQDFSSKYYNVYNYKHFIDMINAAFRTTCKHLKERTTAEKYWTYRNNTGEGGDQSP